MRLLSRLLLASLLAAAAPAAWAFCGFYVAQADAKLFNDSSQVVLVRNGDETVMTMANDYRGALTDFAMVVPVPVVVQKDQVTIADKTAIDRVDAYSAPRLAEYYDPDPCPAPRQENAEYDGLKVASGAPAMVGATRASASKPKVEILASYTVGEYDILILSAKESTALQDWLTDNDYKIPAGAGPILESYIRQNMKFFVAKVNLKEASRTGSEWLRPLQIRYSSPKFMLPIRLGMVNAEKAQDLFVYTLTPNGRVETTNYRTKKIPSNMELPPQIKSDFGSFYKALFDQQVAADGMTTIYTEYSWPLSIMCDPCSADPITTTELRSLGASWVAEGRDFSTKQANAAYLTRLHVRYDLAHFPEDLVFQETSDKSTSQGRYVIRHPFVGDTSCAAGRTYETTLAARQEKEVAELARLTGWSTSTIRSRVPKRANPASPPPEPNFWEWR